MIPIIISFRGVLFASLIVIGLVIFHFVKNSKEKSEYDKITGTIEFYGKEYQNLPIRHKGKYRYLKVDTYQYLFEIYEPNNKLADKKIDELQVGDKIEIHFYETSNTKKIKLNRFIQFIDKEGLRYFIRNGFQRQLSYTIIGLIILINMITYIFWKKGKLEY